MKSLTKDAREFVDGVVKYLKTDTKSTLAGNKAVKALSKVSAAQDESKTALVESAVSLTKEESEAIRTALSDKFHREITVKTEVKPDALGGMRITVGDWIFDATLSNHLKQIQSNLIENL